MSRRTRAAVRVDVRVRRNQSLLLVGFAATALVVSCVELPDTQLKPRGGNGGAGAAAGGAASAGVPNNGGNATSAGGTPSAGKGGRGTAGSATAGGGAGGRTGAGSAGVGSAKAGSPGQGGHGLGAGGARAGGGASDGGAPDAGAAGSAESTGFSTNRDDFFGDSRCKNSNFALCEDFESGTLDTVTWKPRGAGPTIETVRAARGTHSAHFHTTDNGLSYITQTKTFPAPNDTYYARLFVWFDALPTAPAWAHWTISGAQAGTATDAPEIRIGGQWDTNESLELFGVGTDHGVTGDWTDLDADPNGAPKPVPAQQWVCLEWMFDGQANETKFWWDGVEHPSLATSSTNHGGSSDPFILPDFDSMWVGWWLYQTGTDPPEFDVWIDEVAVDYARIGCNH